MKKNRAFSFFVEDKPHFLMQANYFFIPSFEYSDLEQSSDIIIFAPPSALAKIKDAPYIKKIPYLPVSYKPEFYNYHYANSITYIADNEEVFGGYDYILKTDADTFLTPTIRDYYPEGFATGIGYYSNVDIQKRLKEEAEKNRLMHRNYFNVGATWYGSTNDIIEVSKLTVQIMLVLLRDYFSVDWGQWPNWYGGVSSMYAGDMAINHLIDNLQISSKIDYSTAGNARTEEIMLAHCLHTDVTFSKFVFERLGNSPYAKIDLATLDLNLINNYCLFIAETSRRQGVKV